MDVNYVGENLLPGQIGQFFVILSFGAALLSFASYFFATKNPEEKSWQNIARVGFWLNALSILIIGMVLFYIIYYHLFEYHFAYALSSTNFPTHFICYSHCVGPERIIRSRILCNVVI